MYFLDKGATWLYTHSFINHLLFLDLLLWDPLGEGQGEMGLCGVLNVICTCWWPRRGTHPAALLLETPFCNSTSWCRPSHPGFASREGDFLSRNSGKPWSSFLQRLNSRPCTAVGASLSIGPSPDVFSDHLCSFSCSDMAWDKATVGFQKLKENAAAREMQ